MARTYNQECILAYALDLLGERWTLLIVRELFLGPRRFGDLHVALPGIGTNLLSKRLKELETAEIVMASPGAGRGSYRLTDYGECLRPAVRAIMYWSIEYFMKRPGDSAPKDCLFANDLQPDTVALAAEMLATRYAIPHDNYVLHLTIDQHPYTIFYMAGETTAKRGIDTPAVARLDTDVDLMMRLMRGESHVEEVLSQSTSSGDLGVVQHFVSSVLPGADVAFEVAELVKARRLERLSTQAQASPAIKEPAEA